MDGSIVRDSCHAMSRIQGDSSTLSARLVPPGRGRPKDGKMTYSGPPQKSK